MLFVRWPVPDLGLELIGYGQMDLTPERILKV